MKQPHYGQGPENDDEAAKLFAPVLVHAWLRDHFERCNFTQEEAGYLAAIQQCTTGSLQALLGEIDACLAEPPNPSDSQDQRNIALLESIRKKLQAVEGN